MAVSTWDLVFRLDPPDVGMYEVADIALGEWRSSRRVRYCTVRAAEQIRDAACHFTALRAYARSARWDRYEWRFSPQKATKRSSRY